MFCPSCGANNPDGSTFCRECGAPLSAGTSDAPQGTATSQDRPEWQANQAPADAYDSLGTSYQTPATMASDEPAQKKGKGKLIAAVVVLVLLVGLGVGGFFAVRSGVIKLPGIFPAQEQTQESDGSDEGAEPGTSADAAEPVGDEMEPQAGSDATTPEVTSATSGATTPEVTSATSGTTTPEVTSTAPNAAKSGLEGVWTGTLKNKGNTSRACYGGQKMPLVFTVTSVDSHGRITADLKVCYHNHVSEQNAMDSSTDDVYVEYAGIQLLNEGGAFTYVGNVDEYCRGGKLKVNFYYDENNDEITATVEEHGVESHTDYSDDYVLYKD